MIAPALESVGHLRVESDEGSPPKTRPRREGRGKKGHPYKPLPTKFNRDGHDFELITREGDVAIYEQRLNGCPDSSQCFEVIRIRRRNGFEINGRMVEPAEVYPRTETWGADGWTLPSRDLAFAKLREICHSEKSPP